MPSEPKIDIRGCRLCGSPLQNFEAETRLCSICEEYAHQLGVRKDSEMEEAIADLLTMPMFRQSIQKNH